jgi:lysozyme
MAVRGVDVSDFQNVNWTVAANSLDFAATKATEGLTWKSKTFARNWPGIASQGLVRMAYHFAHADSGRSATAEAHEFLNFIHAHGGWRPTDIPVLDLEKGNLSGAALSRWTDEWCRVVEQAWRPGLIYSGKWFAGSRGASFAGPKARGWKLWLAAYVSNPQQYVHSGFNVWTVWQFTDGQFGPQPHSVPGIGKCDIDVFNGSKAALLDFAGAGKPRKYASRTLKLGDYGNDVQQFQRYLSREVNRAAFITQDGQYGPATEKAKQDALYNLGWPQNIIDERGKSKSIGTPGQKTIRDPNKAPASYKLRAKTRKKR